MAYTLRERALSKSLAAQKYILSFLKKPETWRLEDYPVRAYQQAVAKHSGPVRLKPWIWVSEIVGWSISGGGDTKQEAIENLRKTFESNRATDPKLPRPGTEVPIKFASGDQISKHKELSEDFIHRVLDLPWAFISDESTLWDFHELENNDAYYARIQSAYGIDASNVPNANIANILEKIAAHRA
jgi:hypothetical protein